MSPIRCHRPLFSCKRITGIEPASQAWEARILPLNHIRIVLFYIFIGKCQYKLCDRDKNYGIGNDIERASDLPKLIVAE